MRKTKEETEKAVSAEEFSEDEAEEGGSEAEWTPDAGENVQAKKRPQRNVKKRHQSEDEEDDDDEDEDDDDEDEDDSESDSGRKNKKRRHSKKEEDDDEDEDSDENNFDGSSEIPAKDFTSGAFVILKADLNGENDPTLWRIDGKALLQKYLPYKEEGKTFYKSTSTYSGWAIGNKEKYIAAQVTFKSQNRNENIVELDLEKSQQAAKDAPTE